MSDESDYTTTSRSEDKVVEHESRDSRTSTRGRRGADRANIRKITTKVLELQAASPRQLKMLSTVLGVPNNVSELTVAVITGTRNGTTPLTDILALSEPSDPVEALVEAVALGRARLKSIWAILTDLGLANGPLNAHDIRAGGAVLTITGYIEQDTLDEISAVLALAKK